MIVITKDEAMALRNRYGGEVGIAIVNRHKKANRKHYYVEETNRVRFFLERYRSNSLRKTQRERRGL